MTDDSAEVEEFYAKALEENQEGLMDRWNDQRESKAEFGLGVGEAKGFNAIHIELLEQPTAPDGTPASFRTRSAKVTADGGKA